MCHKTFAIFMKFHEATNCGILFVLLLPLDSGRPARFQTSNFIGPYDLHRLLLSWLGLLFRSLPIVLLDQS